MHIDRMGFILKTPKTNECIRFYQEILGFPVWFQNESVTCLGIGSSYILVEPPDSTSEVPPSPSLVIRLNVTDVESEASALRAAGVEAWVDHFDWGTICTFFDPAGSKLELMEARRFRRQTGRRDDPPSDIPLGTRNA
ncbi:MAG: VOC family protein [Fibrobacteria bacterium]|nr:VOC family protein [Fibrobacteria bacterium]